jgi:hypothetical protein
VTVPFWMPSSWSFPDFVDASAAPGRRFDVRHRRDDMPYRQMRGLASGVQNRCALLLELL